MNKKFISKKDLFQYYIIENHTTEETALHFKVHERTMRRRLHEYGISKSLELQLLASRRVQNEKYGGMYVQTALYRERVGDIVEHMKQTCLEKYGTEWVASVESVKEKSRQTFMEKYGVPYYTQTRDCQCKTKRFYKYDGEMFDSSWELALWVYAKDHNEQIDRCPCSFEYMVGNKKHRYFPDFLYNGQLVEIKGDFYLNQQDELVEYNSIKVTEATKAKTECMKEHGVVIMKLMDMQPILDYIFKTYGRSYLKTFQIRKK